MHPPVHVPRRESWSQSPRPVFPAQCRHGLGTSRMEPNIWHSKYCECLRLQHKQGRGMTVVSCFFFFFFPLRKTVLCELKPLKEDYKAVLSLLITFFLPRISSPIISPESNEKSIKSNLPELPRLPSTPPPFFPSFLCFGLVEVNKDKKYLRPPIKMLISCFLSKEFKKCFWERVCFI